MLCGVRLVWRNSASQIFVYFLSDISIILFPIGIPLSFP